MLLEMKNTTNVTEIPLSQIRPNPYQPRHEIEKNSLEELSMSIMQYGLMQPIVVRRMNSCEYELIAGERRFRACQNLGMTEVTAVIMHANGTDSACLALIENIQRENLNYLEEAEAFSTLISDHGLTQEELADKLGKNQSTIANKIRILKLSSPIREILSQNNLTERHARALLRLPDEKSRIAALKIIIQRGLNVVKSEELIEDMILKMNSDGNKKSEGKSIRIFKDIRIFANTIKQAVDMMKQAGISAETNKSENDQYIEYFIRIPKQAG